MSEAELRRLRDDLETVQQAAGLTLPFDWPDVWLTLGLIPVGAAMALWAAFSGEEYLLAALVPALLLALVSGLGWGKRWRKEANRRAWHRETVFASTSAILVGLAMAGYILWGKQVGLSVATLKGAGMVSFGLVCAVLAFTSPARRSYLAGALVMIPLGLAFPFCSGRQMLIVGGLAIMVAGLIGGLIQAFQLRAARGTHERNAN
ncbi:MAG TPA: hypothetical protein VE999_23065 [Gemmataceae bacterium]|nr:hypothetical protein [Gemmataceae bacterium]